MSLSDTQKQIRDKLQDALKISGQWDCCKSKRFKDAIKESYKHLKSTSNHFNAKSFLLRLNEFN